MSSPFYFDELDKIRILEPEVATQTTKLKETCKMFLEKIDKFKSTTDEFNIIIDKLAEIVEREKFKTIGGRNLLQSMEKRKEVDQQQLQALIVEKSMELERLKVQLNSLQRMDMEQQEIIDRLTRL